MFNVIVLIVELSLFWYNTAQPSWNHSKFSGPNHRAYR